MEGTAIACALAGLVVGAVFGWGYRGWLLNREAFRDNVEFFEKYPEMKDICDPELVKKYIRP